MSDKLAAKIAVSEITGTTLTLSADEVKLVGELLVTADHVVSSAGSIASLNKMKMVLHKVRE